ncbi:uncharacterized protein LOC143626230 [Bidens hawaiensis]|uniref:uncharacterized protein LOC143626230 n=1 Tax=Bidens hawaiensis TaxID=980011 RepID=UPI00404A578A
MQGSSSLLSGLPPGSGLQQRPMANVSGQSSNLQNIQNMSAQQNTVGNIVGYNNFANQRQIPGRQQLTPQQLPQQQPQTQNSHYLYRQHLQQMAKQAHVQQQQQMRSHMMHNYIGSSGMQGSSSVSSGMSPGSSLPQSMLQQPMLQQQILQQQKLQQPMLQQQMLQQQKLQQQMLQQQKLQQPMLPQQRNAVQQNQQRLKPTEGASATVVDPTMESGDWRDQLSADSRERIQKRIMDTLRRHLPSFGEQELNKFAKRIEEGFYAVATSQVPYVL